MPTDIISNPVRQVKKENSRSENNIANVIFSRHNKPYT
jgi:hypothetical protein